MDFVVCLFWSFLDLLQIQTPQSSEKEEIALFSLFYQTQRCIPIDSSINT